MKKKITLSHLDIKSFTTDSSQNARVKGGTGTFSQDNPSLCTACPPKNCY
ncbi:MAG: hypothetical protein WBH03_18005 [Cyclobacteriaceae bacterium]